jgi:aryl-alcohol dehydrogenase-like predicted oxidoreductase
MTVGTLETKPLGSSDLKVPVVCLGTMTFGQQNTEEESFAIMDYCLSRGVNWFDTAEL